jgi:hypothetical protein
MPSEGLDATADKNRLGGCFIYLCFASAQGLSEGRMSLGEWIK